MPTNCHTEISETVRSAVDSSPSHGANRKPSPKTCRNILAMPHSGERMSCQMKPMTTTESMVGMKISVR